MNVNDNGCPFCNEFNGHKELSYFEITYGRTNHISDRCLFETKLFSCVPSIGSFVEGYLLLVPKIHFLSILALPKNYLDEMSLICEHLSDFYNEYFHSPYVLYEHGTSNTENVGGMSVTHAHLHFVPCKVSMIPLCSEYDFLTFESIYDASEFYLKYGQQRPYLLLRDINGCFYLTLSDTIPSQFFRKKVAEVLGQAEKYNWKDFPFISNMKRTISAAKEYKLFEKIVK